MAVAIFVLPLLFALVLIPAVADVAAHFLPPSWEDRLGVQVLAEIDQQFLKASKLGTKTRNRLQKRFDNLKALAAQPNAKLVFRRGMVNALALPGGTVLLTDELVKKLADDDEIMAVVAHELGHLHHRHLARNLLNWTLLTVTVNTWLTNDRASGIVTSMASNFLLTARYSRKLESQADQFALELLPHAGLSPAVLGDALAVLEGFDPDDDDPDEKRPAAHAVEGYTMTHPPSVERIRKARAAAPTLNPETKNPADPASSATPATP